MMQDKVVTTRGEVVGIGKIKLYRTEEFNFVLPMFSFLVTKLKDAGEGYAASCIHLQMDGYGDTESGAILDMIDSVRDFLYQNFTDPRCKDKAWENLENLFTNDEWTDQMWNAYHKVQIRLSMQGKSTDEMETLRKWIANLQQRVEKLEARAAVEAKKEIVSWNESLIGYESLEAA
jgi:hypothetical protein